MRKYRNPRYAQESLERKLSPAALVGASCRVRFLRPRTPVRPAPA